MYGRIIPHSILVWYQYDTSCILVCLVLYDDLSRLQDFAASQRSSLSILSQYPLSASIRSSHAPIHDRMLHTASSLSILRISSYLRLPLLNGRAEILGLLPLARCSLNSQTFMNINNWSKPRPRFSPLHAAQCTAVALIVFGAFYCRNPGHRAHAVRLERR